MTDCPKCSEKIEDGSHFCPECGYNIKGGNTSESTAPVMMTVGGMETLDETQTRGFRDDTSTVLSEGTEFAGRYIIKEIIGRGGMGVVYKAEDKLAEKTVALKLIRSDRLGGESAVQKLIAEAITARDIRHPNIVSVYDAGEADGQPFMSMEYLDGQSLRSWHREKIRNREDVPLKTAARIIAEILDGLKAAHKAGVIHRDLKPENIILTGEPADLHAPLKILDFGIARAVGSAMESGTGTGLGTPRYMAPEQITNPDAAGPSADLYSLSILFYELLVDVLPQGHWQPPSGGRSDIPLRIDALIKKGLSNRPANRFQSAASYREELVAAVNLGPVNHKKEHKTKNKTQTTNVNVVLKWLGIGTLVILGLAVIGAFIPDDLDDPCQYLSGTSEYRDCAYQTTIIEREEDGTNIDNVEHTQDKLREQERQRKLEKERLRKLEAERLRKLEEERRRNARYAGLNGQWNDGVGVIYSVQIDKSGAFSGSGISIEGYAVQLVGSMSGNTGTYTVTAPAMGMSFNGTLSWDRGCHINFATYGPYGQVIVVQGQMHVNHVPGGPCPT
jgi:serine/threonine protein kinase